MSDDSVETPHGLCDEDERVCEGVAHGGPLDGHQVAVRFPKGFLAVDRPRQCLWVYDRRDDGDYYTRTDEPAVLDDHKRMVAATGPDYDVLAVDPGDTR